MVKGAGKRWRGQVTLRKEIAFALGVLAALKFGPQARRNPTMAARLFVAELVECQCVEMFERDCGGKLGAVWEDYRRALKADRGPEFIGALLGGRYGKKEKS